MSSCRRDLRSSFARREQHMGDMKDKVKDGIDKAASKTKDMAGKAIDKGKDAAQAAGDSMKKGGDKLKSAGK